MQGAFIRVRGRRALAVWAALALAVAIISLVAGRSTTSTEPGGAASAARPVRGPMIGDLPAVPVAGEVVLDGEPVPGAVVSVSAAAGSPEIRTLVTDERGRFDLGYQAEMPIEVVARTSDARGIRTIDLAEHVTDGTVWLIIPLKPCEQRVTGRLLDRDGHRLAGVPLQERIHTWQPTLLYAGRSDADGTFSVCADEVVAGGGAFAQSRCLRTTRATWCSSHPSPYTAV